jgi:hypothetical protein
MVCDYVPRCSHALLCNESRALAGGIGKTIVERKGQRRRRVILPGGDLRSRAFQCWSLAIRQRNPDPGSPGRKSSTPLLWFRKAGAPLSAEPVSSWPSILHGVKLDYNSVFQRLLNTRKQHRGRNHLPYQPRHARPLDAHPRQQYPAQPEGKRCGQS